LCVKHSGLICDWHYRGLSDVDSGKNYGLKRRIAEQFRQWSGINFSCHCAIVIFILDREINWCQILAKYADFSSGFSKKATTACHGLKN
jgi:hypothetical protein